MARLEDELEPKAQRQYALGDCDRQTPGNGAGLGRLNGSAMPRTLLDIAPGLALATGLAIVATQLGSLAPVVGAPVIAVTLGIIGSVLFVNPRFEAGLAFTSKRILQASIAVLGAGLSLNEALVIGTKSLPVMMGTLFVGLLLAVPFGRLLGLPRDLTTLVGVGTAICGASAIAAVDSVIGAAGVEVAYAIGTIFVFNVAAVLTFPMIGHLLHMSQHGFGLWAGTAINDASSVAAAASVYGHIARTYGIVVKLTRTLMIIPITIVLPVLRRRSDQRKESIANSNPSAPETDQDGNAQILEKTRPARWRTFPLFIGWFIAAMTAESLGLIPQSWHAILGDIAIWLITAALAAIGLSVRLASMRTIGPRPIVLGFTLWLIVALTSLGLGFLTHSI